MNHLKVRLLRRIYLFFSIFLGVFTPLICWSLLPDFNPIDKPLSLFGVDSSTSIIWNSTLFLLSIGIYINAKRSVVYYFKGKRSRFFLNSLLFVSSIALCITALISMENYRIHNISATIYFLVYNFFVFCFGLLRSFKYVRRGIFSIIIGSLMLLSSLLLLPFPSYGIFEIVYLVLVVFWNFIILNNRVRRLG